MLDQQLTLLVVDDEPQIRSMLADFLSDYYHVILAENGSEAVRLAIQDQPDLILMDLMMPVKNGIEACKELRANSTTKHMPILMLTAADSVDKRIEAFDIGADDFIAKPFEFEELLSRLKSKYNRMVTASKPEVVKISNANLTVNVSSHEVFINEEPIKLSPSEFAILKLLVENIGNVVTRQTILKAAWNDEPESSRLIDAHFTSLRKKIKGYSGKLETIYGVGYKLT